MPPVWWQDRVAVRFVLLCMIQLLGLLQLVHGVVKRVVGAPSRRHAAVGQPPITRWDYPGFSVYFEYDKVINSVRQHKAP